MVSGPDAMNAAWASAPPACSSKLAKLTWGRPAISPRTATNGVPAGNTACTAR